MKSQISSSQSDHHHHLSPFFSYMSSSSSPSDNEDSRPSNKRRIEDDHQVPVHHLRREHQVSRRREHVFDQDHQVSRRRERVFDQEHQVPRRRERERFQHRVVRVQRVEGIHPSERKRQYTLRAFYKFLHSVRHEVAQFRTFTDELQRDLENNEWSDITPKFMLSKQIQFLQRMHQFGHCPVSGDAIGSDTYINHCGHVFNKVSLETANPKLESCPTCSKQMVYPFDF